MLCFRFVALIALFLVADVALAGPPYTADDPEPTDVGHYEVYFFATGREVRDGNGGDLGIDFNYGAAPDLQLTAVLPFGYAKPSGGNAGSGLGNVELGVKYRFAHQAETGWDIAVFPTVILPSNNDRFGDKHASLLLPIWLEKDWDNWSMFGGGGCELNRGGESKSFCLAGWAVTRQITPRLQLGTELVHQAATTKSEKASTGIGAGLRFDLSDRLHFLAYAGPSLEHDGETSRYKWYTSLLLAF